MNKSELDELITDPPDYPPWLTKILILMHFDFRDKFDKDELICALRLAYALGRQHELISFLDKNP